MRKLSRSKNPKNEKSLKSPLRYPGGKSRAFLGGGSIELALANQGVRVFGYDAFEPLVAFWKQALSQPCKLATESLNYYPLEKDKFYEIQKSIEEEPDTSKRAVMFYVLNRSSFSGSTLSGGMSPGHDRFTLSAIERLSSFKCPNLTVEHLDFKETLSRHINTFLYLDPPYLISSYLYGKKGNTHRGFDHSGLASLLKERDDWILSYNDCPEIRDAYKGFSFIAPQWEYGMSKNKKSKELLILSPSMSERFRETVDTVDLISNCRFSGRTRHDLEVYKD
jgi:DNA adenine methylase